MNKNVKEPIRTILNNILSVNGFNVKKDNKKPSSESPKNDRLKKDNNSEKNFEQ